MRYLGKRSDRMRLPKWTAVDPELGIVIRSRGQRMGRSNEMQILHFIEVGVDHDPEVAVTENGREEVHATAQNVTLPFAGEHGPAPRNTERHTTAHRRPA